MRPIDKYPSENFPVPKTNIFYCEDCIGITFCSAWIVHSTNFDITTLLVGKETIPQLHGCVLGRVRF